jgi:GT2 family glycosyltransferase
MIIKNNPKVAILLLNYNGWKDAIKCLESVYKTTYPNWEIILIDNGSEDDSVLKIKEWAFKYSGGRKSIKYIEELFYDEKEWGILPLYQKLSILRIKKNCGFTGSNNIGIEYVLREKETDYIVLLSNDTVVEKEFLGELVRIATSDEKIGLLQPKMLKMANPKIIDSTGHVFGFGSIGIVDRGVGEIDKGQYDNKLDIIGACAGACMYKREMLEDVGLFDKNFFMYYEDAELSWRAHKQGWKGRFVPSAIVYHKRAGTTGKDKKRKREMTKLCLRNMITTVGRHGTIYQKFLFPIFLLIEAVKWIRRNNFAK